MAEIASIYTGSAYHTIDSMSIYTGSAWHTIITGSIYTASAWHHYYILPSIPPVARVFSSANTTGLILGSAGHCDDSDSESVIWSSNFILGDMVLIYRSLNSVSGSPSYVTLINPPNGTDATIGGVSDIVRYTAGAIDNVYIQYKLEAYNSISVLLDTIETSEEWYTIDDRCPDA